MADSAAVPAWRVWPVRAALCVLALLCPLKFGMPTVAGGDSLFPADAWEWIFAVWPPFLAPVLAGVVLLLCVLLLPAAGASGFAWFQRGAPGPKLEPKPPDAQHETRNAQRGRMAWLFPAAWCGFLLCLLPGLLRTTERDAAWLMLGQWTGVAAFAVAAWWALAHDRRLGGWLLAALAAGTLLTAWAGWLQGPGGGLAAALKAAEANGMALPPEVVGRIREGRVFGTFVYPNSFAAHLILTGPLAVWAAWHAGGFFRPARVSRLLLAGFAAAALGGGLWFSGSRAAMLSLGVGACAAVAAVPALRRWRGVLLAGIAVLAVAGAVAGTLKVIRHKQGEPGGGGPVSVMALSSLGARAEYASASVKMFASAPLVGVGLGEFFPYYTKLRPAGVEDTRQSHNMVLGYAAQAGVLAGLAALALLALPFFLGRIAAGGSEHATRNAQHETHDLPPGLLLAVQAGTIAWGLHALADFNSEIAGSVMVFALLPLLAVGRGKKAKGGIRDAEPGNAGIGNRKLKTGILLRLAAAGLALAALAAVWRWPGERAFAGLCRTSADRSAPLAAVADSAAAAARLLPESPYPWNILGRRALAEREWRTAADSFALAAARTPHRSGFWAGLAEAEMAAGDGPAARRAAARAVEWNPASPEILGLRRRVETGEASGR